MPILTQKKAISLHSERHSFLTKDLYLLAPKDCFSEEVQ